MRLLSPRTAAAGRALALVAILAATAIAAPAALAQAGGATAPARTAPAAATTPADPESQLIPEGSAAPTSIGGDGAGTLLRMGLGLVVVVGLIAAVWYVMKRVQRSRYPALDERGAGALIEVVTTTQLGPGKSLHLIRVGDELVLVGAGEGALTRLASLDPEQAAALVDAPGPRLGPAPGGPTGPGAEARARAAATATGGSLVDRLRAMTTRR